MSLRPRRTLQAPLPSRINCVAWSPDGCKIASGSDLSINIWDGSTFALIATSRGERRTLSVAFTPDSNQLVSGGGRIQLWDVQGMSHLRNYEGHDGIVYEVAVSPDGSILASGSEDGTIFLWRLDTAECIQVLGGHASGVRAVAFSFDGRRLASGSGDNTIAIWDLQSYSCIKTLTNHSRCVTSLSYSADGCLLASGSVDNTICIYNATTYERLRTIRGDYDWVLSVRFTPNSRTLLFGCGNSLIYAHGELQVWEGHTNGVTSVAVSPDGACIVSGSNDQTVRIWSLPPATDASTTPKPTTQADALVSKSELSKMNIKQVGQLLRAQGVDESTIATFKEFNVWGNMIVDGINETEIMEMGFKSSIQVRGIQSILLRLTSEEVPVEAGFKHSQESGRIKNEPK